MKYIQLGPSALHIVPVTEMCKSVSFQIAVEQNSLSNTSSQSLSVFMIRMIKVTAVIIEAYHCYQLHTQRYQTFLSQG